MKVNDFARKMMSNSVAQGINFGSRWLLNLALARHLLEREFGLFSFVYMLANLLFPTLAYGVSFYLIHHTAQQRQISALLSSLIISALLFVLLNVMFSLYAFTASSALPYHFYLLSLLIGLIWAFNQAVFSYLKGAQQFSIEVKGQLLGGGCMLLLVAAVWFEWLNDTASILTWIIVVSVPSLLVGCWHLWPEFKQHRASLASRTLWQQIWQPSIWRERFSYAWHDVFAIYLTNIPFIFLALFSSLTALGQFRKAFILFMPVTLLPVVFSQVLLAKLANKTVFSERVALFRRSLLLTFPLLSLPYLLLLLLYPWLYPWLLNEELTPSASLVTGLVVVTLWLTLFKTYFEVWLTALGYSHWRAGNVTLIAILGSLAYFVVNNELTPELAAWIFMASNLAAVLCLQGLSWRVYRRESKQQD